MVSMCSPAGADGERLFVQKKKKTFKQILDIGVTMTAVYL